MERAVRLEDMSRALNQLFRRLTFCANRELLYDLYPYVWDMRGVVSLLNSYVKWLGKIALISQNHIYLHVSSCKAYFLYKNIWKLLKEVLFFAQGRRMNTLISIISLYGKKSSGSKILCIVCYVFVTQSVQSKYILEGSYLSTCFISEMCEWISIKVGNEKYTLMCSCQENVISIDIGSM